MTLSVCFLETSDDGRCRLALYVLSERLVPGPLLQAATITLLKRTLSDSLLLFTESVSNEQSFAVVIDEEDCDEIFLIRR